MLKKPSRSFRVFIKKEFDLFLEKQKNLFPEKDLLKIDLHCHDQNSNKSDIKVGRMLNAPETWLPTSKLEKILKDKKMTAFTVTNHNNARTCFELKSKGKDILAGAEFDCTMPEYGLNLHVLTYGIEPKHEADLKIRRKNIYKFVEYCRSNQIETVLAHPLYFTTHKNMPPFEAHEKLSLIFDKFEGVNGQRDSWQNLLISTWILGLNSEKIDELSKKTGINPRNYCSDPYKKSLTGGSDDHMGIFAGGTGTYIYINDLQKRLMSEKTSDLVLEGLRNCNTAPFGSYNDITRMSLSLLDYFCQCVIHLNDPGLIRMLLHKGTNKDKLLSVFIANAIGELRRHKYTTKFLISFHEAFQGKRANFFNKLFISKPFKPVVKEMELISAARRKNPNQMEFQINSSIDKIYRIFSKILYNRIKNKISENIDPDAKNGSGIPVSMQLLNKLEVPSEIRSLLGGTKTMHKHNMTDINVANIFDHLSFPILASIVLQGVGFAGAKVMYEHNEYLNVVAEKIGKYRQPKRALWLTDTFEDTNGISVSLRNILTEIQNNDHPIDMLVCNSSVKDQDHLISIEPINVFTLPQYKNQEFRIPNLMEIQKVFINGGYDRIICSTEIFMGVIALYLKYAFNVPAYFYMHTDWMEFAKKTLNFDGYALGRFKRILRSYYKQFEGLFVLNQDDKNWLTGRHFQIPKKRVFLTKHWVDQELFKPRDVAKSNVFENIKDNEIVLLYTGRISQEKGVLVLPKIYRAIKNEKLNVRFAIIGEGPAEKELQKQMPDAVFKTWVDQEKLPDMYSAADLFVFPSTFDTFGRVVLEAISCGLPVCALNVKGPKSIIGQNDCGLLENNIEDLCTKIVELIKDKEKIKYFKKQALKRASEFNKEKIMCELLETIDLKKKQSKESINNEQAVDQRIEDYTEQKVLI